MEKVTYFDVEYANSKNKSICQIGIMCEDYRTSEPFYPELDIYVNPEDGFDDVCTKVHGITNEKVKNKPPFPIVWRKIEKYFTNAVVIGHNVASADIDALVKALKRYNLDIPELYYICTYELAKEFVPSYCVKNYSMSSLCEYFDIDIDSEHNAFDDACACSDLFKTLVDIYDIDVDSHVKKYIPHEIKKFSAFVANSVLRKSISEFYGIVRGFSIDNLINKEEIAYIKNWRTENAQFANQKDIADIIGVIDEILEDETITIDEAIKLQCAIKSYLDVVSTSTITLATQILDGILKGIIVDGKISEDECKNLRQWLYDNIYLSDHYPFNKIIKLVDKVLADSIITKEESTYITSVIDDMLNPVDSLKSQVYSVNNKHVCLSGNFSYGQKSDVEKYIAERGGIIDSSVKKITDFLIIGDCECQAYSYGTYGTKVKKALEYNEKGCNIKIIKESDFFS
jgi:DNA polymerase-3 subunit epsilon